MFLCLLICQLLCYHRLFAYCYQFLWPTVESEEAWDETIKEKECYQDEEWHRLFQTFSHSHKKCFYASGMCMNAERGWILKWASAGLHIGWAEIWHQVRVFLCSLPWRADHHLSHLPPWYWLYHKLCFKVREKSGWYPWPSSWPNMTNICLPLSWGLSLWSKLQQRSHYRSKGLLRSVNAASIPYLGDSERVSFAPPCWEGSCVVAVSVHLTLPQPVRSPVTWNMSQESKLPARHADQQSICGSWGQTWGLPGTSPCKWMLRTWFG